MHSDQDGSGRALEKTMGAVLAMLPERPFAVRLPDGGVIPAEPADTTAEFTLVLKRPGALRSMFLPPSELALGEGFIFDDFDIEGDLVAAFGLIDGLKIPPVSPSEVVKALAALLRLERMDRGDGERAYRGYRTSRLASAEKYGEYVGEGVLHSRERDRQAVQFHYDISNDFYKLWLDERLVYSCAYFTLGNESLEDAQEQKLERICRKLRLQPREKFLDIGCGFGALLIHAVMHYDVEGLGISLSEAQSAEARTRFEAAKIEDRCRIDVVHYEAFEPEMAFDKIASVGMFEHVGKGRLADYFAKARHLLKPGGLFLLQGGAARTDRRHVGRGWMDRLGWGRNAFMQKYSFPDSRMLDIPTVICEAELAGFETRDVESLREHYPLTLRHWLQRLEGNEGAVTAQVGQVAYRAWRLILAGYIHLIEKGQLSEYQTLFAKPTTDGRVQLPLARVDAVGK